ncbi:hypothetical protein IW138_004278 [Coemansia sp. RSA 986]|nr:hypothetical protein IW138_004278 [Coemansia sp. RSA 986]
MNNSNVTENNSVPDPTSDEHMQLYLEQQKKEKEVRETLTKEWTERLVGKKYVEHKEGDEAILDEHAFSEASLRKPFRILKGKNVAMTMDYCTDRLNVRLDDNGVCTEVFFV